MNLPEPGFLKDINIELRPKVDFTRYDYRVGLSYKYFLKIVKYWNETYLNILPVSISLEHDSRFELDSELVDGNLGASYAIIQIIQYMNFLHYLINSDMDLEDVRSPGSDHTIQLSTMISMIENPQKYNLKTYLGINLPLFWGTCLALGINNFSYLKSRIETYQRSLKASY